MSSLAEQKTSLDREQVALKAVARILQNWRLSLSDAARLVDMSLSTWKRAKEPGFKGDLTQDQMLRLSAIIGVYKSLNLYFSDSIASQWMTLPNKGPLFDGARPLDIALEGGLPQLIRIRSYLDALRGGM